MIYPVNSFPGRTFTSDNKEYYYFGGTAYLGLQTDIEFQDLYLSNIRKYGTGYAASRASNVRFSVFKKAEAHLAESHGCEACFTLSSGYLASQLVANYFAQKGYELFYAPATHVALHTIHAKNAPGHTQLQESLMAFLHKNPNKPPVLLLDSIDFFAHNYPDFSWLKKLPLQDIILVADDSHGFGITGSNGNGTYTLLEQLQPKELIVCGSLGKGYGIQAGAVLGTQNRIHKIQDSPLFAASSPAVPAAMATYLQAGSIYQQKREKLQKNIRQFTTQIKQPTRYFNMPNHPAFTFKDDGLTDFLEERFMVITNFPYPNDTGDKINRIVLSAQHTEKDISLLCQTINNFDAAPKH